MRANQMSAGYLFQPDKHYEISLDTGDKTIQCGRHIDILKLWLGWKARGNQGYAEHVDDLLEKANFFYENICQRQPYFETIMKVIRKVLISYFENVFCSSHRLSMFVFGIFHLVYKISIEQQPNIEIN